MVYKSDAKISDVMRTATAEVREALQLVGDYYEFAKAVTRAAPFAAGDAG